MVLAILVLLSAEPAAPTVTVEVDGEAAVVNGDVLRATEEAKLQALGSAVEQVSGIFVHSQTAVLHRTVAHDHLATVAHGFVKTFKVTPVESPPEVVRVHVRAEVLAEPLKTEVAALEALLGRLGDLTIAIDVDERDPDGAGGGAPFKAALAKGFTADGWTVAGPGAQADFTLHGSVRYRAAQPGVDVNGELTLADGRKEVVGSVRLAAVTTASAAAYAKEFAPRVLTRLHEELLDYTRNSSVEGLELALRVQNMSYDEVSTLQTRLGRLGGVLSVEALDFENGAQRFRLRFKGQPEELKRLLSTVKVGQRPLLVISVKGREVNAGLK